MEVHLHVLLTLTLDDVTGKVYSDPFTNREKRRGTGLRVWFRSGLEDLEQRTISYSCRDTDHDSSHSQFNIPNYFGFSIVYI